MPSRRRIRPLLLALTALTTAAAALPAPAAATPLFGPATDPYGEVVTGPDYVDTPTSTRPVAPGVTLTSFDRYDARGFLRADALTVDLSGSATVDYVFPGAVAATQPLSQQVAARDDRRIVGGINGDFFDINNSGAAQGVGIRDGELIQAPIAGHHKAVGFTAGDVGRLVEVYFEGAATPEGSAPIALSGFNTHVLGANAVGVYTGLWGTFSRGRPVTGASRAAEVVLRDGVVESVSATPGSGAIADGTQVLLGREAGADALAALTPGTRVQVSYRPRSSDGGELSTAIGGNVWLVRDGQVSPEAAVDADNPRSAVGFDATGTKMYLLTVDGRQADSHGLTLRDLAVMMQRLGAHDALNLDGGGSSTLLAREPGSAAPQIENAPSDGTERPTPNGLAVLSPVGSGRLHGFRVETATAPMAAPTLNDVRGGRPDRVFPGHSRKLTAAGHDETYGPAAGTPSWLVFPPIGRVEGGAFQALAPGSATVTAFRGTATGKLGLTVLNPLTRISPTAGRLSLAGVGSTGSFGVLGFDRDAQSAPIEAGEVALSYDSAIVDITPDGTGGFKVTGRADGGTVVALTVDGFTTRVGVTVGAREVVVANFDDAAAWKCTTARATCAVAPAPGHDGQGLRMSYDFTQSTGTRTSYATPPALIELPGQPLAVSMWVNPEAGRGEWARMQVYDGTGALVPAFSGPYLTGAGWQKIEFPVPAGLQHPLKFRWFYPAEIKPDASYTNAIVIDDLAVKLPAEIDVPADPAYRRDFVIRDGAAADEQWRFAVMSDAQFVARNPDSDLVRNARRTLREIKAAAPDFLVINGDFVDEAAPADIALAKQILDEELGGTLPYYYVPGNHEIMGPGNLDNFRAVFGDTHRVVDHRGTRLVMLDSSKGTLRGGGFDQVLMLRRALDEAAGDPAVGSVAVFFHHPPRDPTPVQASELAEAKEVATVERWLADFQWTSGKGAAMVNSHVGTFAASEIDGVPYLINGNSGKAPSTSAAEGGFTGWTMVGVDPVTPLEWLVPRLFPQAGVSDWFRAEIRPHVDELALTAPASLAVGASAPVPAVVTQAGRQVPVAYPVSADWAGTVHIGPARTAPKSAVAAYDPATGQVTALRSGTATLTVTVNAVTTSATITVS